MTSHFNVFPPLNAHERDSVVEDLAVHRAMYAVHQERSPASVHAAHRALVDAGVESYGRRTKLIDSWARADRFKCLPEGEEPEAESGDDDDEWIDALLQGAT